MFYKKEENGNWNEASEVTLTSGEIATSDNRIEGNGWKWHDTPPQEYEDFIQAQAEYENWEQTQ
jgi:hypothetical protein